MNWERLTAPEFEKAVVSTDGVCLLPIGVIEKHGDHLPLGQDILFIHKICTLAAEREPCVVFPFYFLGQIQEACHVPGTIALRTDLLLPVLENLCDEIGRNGLKKIIIANGHGGNIGYLKFFGKTLLEKEKDYMVYVSHPFATAGEFAQMKEASVDGHGGEKETSSMLALYPELVHLDRFADYGMPEGRYDKFSEAGLESGIHWYATYPGHLAAQKVPFTEEKGRVIVEDHVSCLVRQLKLVKSDSTPFELYREYHRKRKRVPGGV